MWIAAAGLRLGAAIDGVARLGPAETTKLSRLGISASYSTSKQVNLTIPTMIWFKGGQHGLQGDWRYLDMSQNTYGLGPVQPDSLADNVGFQLLRFQETGYIRIANDLYGGIGYRLDHHFGISDPNANGPIPSPLVDYNGGQNLSQTTSSGGTFSLLYESRDNPINPSKGFLLETAFHMYAQWLGSDDSWQAFQFQFRIYPRLDRRGDTTLALRAFAWTTFGHAPYLDLPAIGWDRENRTGRGYVQGRIRAANIWYAEAELRQQITRNGLIGAAAFFNLTSASDVGGTRLSPADQAYGIGLRLKLNKKTGSNITADLGFDKFGKARFYLGTGEAF
jgi:outer membrane protein assembly factor BamA